MKKVLFYSILSLSFFAPIFAYTPSDEEKAELTELKGQITQLGEESNLTLWNLYEQARNILPYITDEKINYYITQLRDYSLTKFTTKKDKAKDATEDLKKEITEEYKTALENAESLSENCYGWYNTLDNLSYAYDFPTALTIAIWYRESSCWYYLPKNGDWPFQITSKDYWNWEISKEIFEQTIKDFLEFSWNKINRYNSKNPDTPILMWYKYFTYDGLYKFAGLYNWLSGWTVYWDIAPANEKYFLEKMPWEYENWKKNWLFLQFLKVLERELENN